MESLSPFSKLRRDIIIIFISSFAEEQNEDGDYGILIMATDGLWDVSENEAVARTVFQTLHKYPTEKHRYTMVAQELVAKARGKINDYGHWRLADSKAAATVDDISVIVIPVYQYYKEHIEWEQKCLREYRERLERERTATAAAQAIEAKEDTATSASGTNEQTLSLVNGVQEMAQVEIEPVLNDEEQQQQTENEATIKRETQQQIQVLSFIEQEQQSTIDNEKLKGMTQIDGDNAKEKSGELPKDDVNVETSARESTQNQRGKC